MSREEQPGEDDDQETGATPDEPQEQERDLMDVLMALNTESSETGGPRDSFQVTVNLSAEAWDTVQRLAKEQDKRVPVLFRDLIAVGAAVHSTIQAGGRIFVRAPSRRTWELRFPWFGPQRQASGLLRYWKPPWQ
jgi:hypothetical protein